MTFKDKFEEFYIVGQKYSRLGNIYTLDKIIPLSNCSQCSGTFGCCDGIRMVFTPTTDWKCPYHGHDLAYEKVQSTNVRW